MPHVTKLVNFFEGLSGGQVVPSKSQSNFRHSFQHGFSSPLFPKTFDAGMEQTCKSGIPTKSNDFTDNAHIEKQSKSIFSGIYDRISDIFKGSSLMQSTDSVIQQLSDTRQEDVREEQKSRVNDVEWVERNNNSEEILCKVKQNGHGNGLIERERISLTGQNQLLGSTRKSAYLIGEDTKNASQETGTKKGKVSKDSGLTETTNAKERFLHARNDLKEANAIGNRLPKFSLLSNGSGAGSQYESESITSIQSQFADDELNHEINIQKQSHDWKETGEKLCKATSGSSGIYTGSVTTLSNMVEERQGVEHQTCSTKRYVDDVSSGNQLPSRIKYPSEPTILQPCKARTLTQENILNIKDSSVSIYSLENKSGCTESVTASQFSLFSSEKETRESIAEHTRESLKEHKKCMKIAEPRRLKKGRKVLEEEGFLIIVDEEGSGSTHLAWDLLLEDKSKEKYNLLDVYTFPVCIRSKEPVIILVDDAFGATKLNEPALETCLKYVKLCKKKRSSRTVKIIFTIKHHIASQCKRKLSDYKKCIVDLDDPKIQLDGDEMFEISKAIVENNRDELKIQLSSETDPHRLKPPSKKWELISESFLTELADVALPSGFPKKFRQFLDTRANIRQGLTFFTRPTEDLLDEIIYMKRSEYQSDLDKNLTLMMIAVCGEKLKLEKIGSIDANRHRSIDKPSTKMTKRKFRGKIKTKEEATETPWWIEIINHYAKHCPKSLFESVKKGLDLLKGNYIKENMKGVFEFASPCVKNAVLISCSQDFPQFILKLCDLPFFKDYVCTDSCFEMDNTRFIQIDVLNKSLCSEANEKLKTLCDGGDTEAFAKHRLFNDPTFLQQFIESFGKETDRLSKMLMNDGEKDGRCVISCAIENKPHSSHQKTSNLAYSIILHKAWSQKRKICAEWTSRKELEVITYCCEQGHKEVYFELRRKYKIPVNYECLQLAIKSGTFAIVEDILGSIGKDISDEEKCKCMELALLKYTKSPLKSRHEVVNALLKFVSVDYKIKGVDPIIHTATKTNDARVIVTLEVFDGDINITNSHGKTILHEAIKRNKAAFLLMALKHGADQKKADKHGYLPIHEGAKENKPYMIELLMEADFDIAVATDRSGRQPLHYAAIYNSVEAANCLIEHDVGIDVYDCEQKTPLHYAAESGKGTVIHSLLEAHADTRKEDKYGRSPLVLACKSRNVKGFKRLIRDESAMESVSVQNECLFIAVEENQAEILKMMVEKGVDINQKNRDGKTLLHFAIEVNAGMVQQLIEEKVDVNIACNNMFPVHVAASEGRVEVIQMLAEAGAGINEVTLDSGDTVLHIAIENGHNELAINILEEDNSLIGFRNKRGEVPLHIAARHGNLSVTHALLNSGAERSPINKCFETPLTLVKEKLSELGNHIHTKEYENHYKVMMLLSGHRVMRETAL
ncbi:uncharacterized protein LOC123543606 isoform X1 [Mercenaria mercenaria]|uniref:uncharacterized protein LOC123543606 isoform X1 n=1 Tax=Mercenaria mercenaria TaxID=6596 RepID=UPI00234E6D83|nr:uncharacterized protein LOC123543606 isoform X1 [Mercenaria mercenaria]XP_045190192.2 uncharacterized protein LOC123543606 isoform X1 [Mercenaria mercenaria]